MFDIKCDPYEYLLVRALSLTLTSVAPFHKLLVATDKIGVLLVTFSLLLFCLPRLALLL